MIPHRPAAIALALAISAAMTMPARADFKVWTPDVNEGELAIENVGDLGTDHQHGRSGERSSTYEVEYGVTPWWQTEIEYEYERDAGPGQPNGLTQVTSENMFQFTQRGQYWLDAGFFAEYGRSKKSGDPNEFTVGPVLRKDVWGTSNSINLFFEKAVGANADGRPVFSYAWETRVDAWVLHMGRNVVVEPGLQIYGTLGPLGRFAKWNDEDERAGPQLFGKVFDLGPGTLEWNAGLLFGLTPSVPRRTLRWQAEYEVHF